MISNIINLLKKLDLLQFKITQSNLGSALEFTTFGLYNRNILLSIFNYGGLIYKHEASYL